MTHLKQVSTHGYRHLKRLVSVRTPKRPQLWWRTAILPAALVLLYIQWRYSQQRNSQVRIPEATLLDDDTPPKVETRYGRALTSHYAGWIESDFSKWNVSLISKALVERAAAEFPCQSGKLRIQIVGGTLWVDHSQESWPAGGWYPAELGGGWTSAKARTPYLILALLETLREYPGKVPDVDAVFHISDEPCVPTRVLGPNGEPAPPIFGYTATAGFADIPFPDFSFWGHEHTRMRGNLENPVQGWERQFDLLANNVSAAIPLHLRTPQLMWRGRVSDDRRDDLRRQFVQCPEVFKALQLADHTLFNLWEPEVKQDEVCGWRYQAYVESNAWATNFKQKLACGSVVIAIKPRFFEFFTRALRPGVHYLEVEPPAASGLAFASMCVALARQIKYMERAFQEATLPVNEDVDLALTYEDTEESLDSLNDPAKLNQAASPVDDGFSEGDAWGLTAQASPPTTAGHSSDPADAIQSSSGTLTLPSLHEMHRGNSATLQRAKASQLSPDDASKPFPLPWDVAANGQEFLRQHVRMKDVREYIRDALIMYSSLQDFQPAVVEGAECYTGASLHRQFGFPFEIDKRITEVAFPWLKDFVQPGCPPPIEADVPASGATETTLASGFILPKAELSPPAAEILKANIGDTLGNNSVSTRQ